MSQLGSSTGWPPSALTGRPRLRCYPTPPTWTSCSATATPMSAWPTSSTSATGTPGRPCAARPTRTA